MKKFFTFYLAAALCTAATAQEIKVFSCGLGVPGLDEPQLMVEAISADGKYICGGLDMGEGVFVANTETGEVKFTIPDGINDDGAELRGVDMSGRAIGFSGDFGITYGFSSGEVTVLENPDDVRMIIGEAITNDGSMLVGSVKDNALRAAYTTDGVKWTRLPMPPEDKVLLLLKNMPDDSAAKRVSADGKVILGFIGSFQIPCLWVKDDNGDYQPDLFLLDFFKLKAEDLNDDAKPLSGVSAHYMNMSNNGRYVCLLGLIQKNGEDYAKVPIVYDTTTKSLRVYSEDQEVDFVGLGLYPTAVSNDGTFIGSIGSPFYDSIGSYIMKAGQTQAELFVDAFPQFNERYQYGDFSGMNVPVGISADGRYITGYIFYSDDYNDMSTPAYYESYVIDSGDVGAVDSFMNDVKVAEAIYSIDGRILRSMTKGLNIVRNSDGSVSKILK